MFDVCPRCNNAWSIKLEDNTLIECEVCDIFYLKYSHLLSWRPFSNSQFRFIWDCKKLECRFTIGEPGNWKSIYLPYLPFNVSVDKIRLYLTFT